MAIGVYVPYGVRLKRIGLFLGVADALKSDLLEIRRVAVLRGSFSQLADVVNKPWRNGSVEEGPSLFFFAIFVCHDCARTACRTQCSRSGYWERWFNPLINPAPLRRHLRDHPKLRPLPQEQKRLLTGSPELIRRPRMQDEMLQRLIREQTLTALNVSPL